MPGRLFLPRWRKKGGEYQTSSVWRWEVPDGHGGKFQGSTKIRGGEPGKPPKEARAVLIQKLAEHGRAELLDPVAWETAAAMLLADQTARGLKSVASTEDRLFHVGAYFDGTKLDKITPSRVTAYALHRRAQGAAVATINHELTLIGQAFNLALRDGLIVRRPKFRTLPGTNIRQGFVPDDEFAAIVQGMSDHCRDVVLFLRLTGWRESEPLQLQWSQVDWEHCAVRIEASQTKRSYARTFPFRFYPPLKALMEKRLAEHGRLQADGWLTPLVFCNRFGGPLTRSAVYSSWAHARAKLGSRKTVHDLRRTWAREARARGLHPATTMELGGWRTMSMLMRYSISDLESLSQEIKVLSGPDLSGLRRARHLALVPSARTRKE